MRSDWLVFCDCGLLMLIILLPVLKYCCCLVAQLCLTFYYPVDCSMPGFPVLHRLPEFPHTHVHCVDDAIQPSQALLALLLLHSVFPSIREATILQLKNTFPKKDIAHAIWES